MHQIRQPSRPRTMPFSVQQQARTTLVRLPFLGLGSICRLGPDLAARYRVAACSTTLSQALEKSNTVRGHNCTPLFAFSPIWEKIFLFPPWPTALRMHLKIVCRLDRDDTLDDVPQNKSRRFPLGYFLTKLHKQDFAGPLSNRASRVLGPISRDRVADILPHMKFVSRASRVGVACWLPSHTLQWPVHCTEISH